MLKIAAEQSSGLVSGLDGWQVRMGTRKRAGCELVFGWRHHSLAQIEEI